MDGPGLERWRKLVLFASLALILAFAAFARTYDLPTNPGGLWADEAAEALSARHILRDPSYRPLMLPENGGREALYAYTVAVGFAAAGESVLTLRLVAGAWGVAGVLGIWLLARRFGAIAALAGSAWAAGSLWLIAVSRDGMRNTFTPFFGALALYALLAWNERRSMRWAVFAGAVLGLASMYTYQPLRGLPVIALVWLLWLRRDKRQFATLRPTIPVAVVAFLVVSAPMILAAVQDPQAWLGRAVSVTPFNPALTPEHDFLSHVVSYVLMFTSVGDPNARHNVDGQPLLGWGIAAIALVGLAALWRRRSNPSNSLILLSLPVFLFPALIAIEGGSPHFLRVLGIAAPLGVLIGRGAAALVSWSSARSFRGLKFDVARAAAGGLLVAVFLGTSISSTWIYLRRPAAERFYAFSGDVVAMAGLVRPGDSLVLDDFNAMSVEFLLDDAMPPRVAPGEQVPADAQRVLGLTSEELRSALGTRMTGDPVPVAIGPDGQPAVWAAEVP
jgi:Dolichyl-phosphate-mannose-protein mannosyltransferase